MRSSMNFGGLAVALLVFTGSAFADSKCSTPIESISDPLFDKYGMWTDYIYFTTDLIDNYKLNEDEVKKLQFYTSSDISFSRQVSDGTREVTSGQLIVKNGKLVNEVNVKRKTQGEAVDYDWNWRSKTLSVSFEEGSSAFLKFVSDYRETNSRFCLALNSVAESSCDGEVSFERGAWGTQGNSGNACLIIDKKLLSKFKKTARTLPGRKVKE